MPTLEFSEYQINYLDEGSGPPAILLHAGGSSGRQWREVIERIGSCYRCIAPDLFGFGKTEAWKGEESLNHDHHAELVSSFVDWLDEPIRIIGHSYGGAAAVRFLLSTPGLVRSCCLIEPIMAPLLDQSGDDELYGEYRKTADDFFERASRGDREIAWQNFIDYRNGAGSWESYPDKAKQRMLAQTDAAVAAFGANLDNATTIDDCRSIATPTLIVCGNATTAPERRITEILADAIPESLYEIIDGAGHMSPMTHPRQVAELILTHL